MTLAHTWYYIKDHSSSVWYGIKYGVANLIRWFPVVWQDRQWDYYYLMRILEFKLKLMEQLFDSEDAVSVGARDRAYQMNRCHRLLARIMADDYNEQGYAAIEKRWGKMYCVPYDYDANGKPRTHQVKFSRVITDEDREQERQDVLAVTRKHDELKQRDTEVLFDLMRNNIFSWWD